MYTGSAISSSQQNFSSPNTQGELQVYLTGKQETVSSAQNFLLTFETTYSNVKCHLARILLQWQKQFRSVNKTEKYNTITGISHNPVISLRPLLILSYQFSLVFPMAT
jgi:hypothetical protein